MLSLERDALACSGIKPAGRCRTVALMVSYGLLGTPKSRIIRETIKAWIDLLKLSDDSLIHDINLAWPIARKKLIVSNCPVNAIRGIMSNVQFILMGAGWYPSAFNCWRDEEGSQWTLTDFSISPDIVSSAICKAHFNRELIRAATHFDGKGIQDGIDYHNTMIIRSLSKDRYSYKCALETIIVAGSWPMARVHDINPQADPICTRCGAAPDTTLHCYWQCAANGQLEDEAVCSTQSLCPAAVEGSAVIPCLWLRGILPEKLTKAHPDKKPPLDVTTTHINNTVYTPIWDSGTYYGDASGGDFSSVPLIRRVGVGLCSISPQGNLLFGVHRNLPGEVQPVPRGEYICTLFTPSFGFSYGYHRLCYRQ